MAVFASIAYQWNKNGALMMFKLVLKMAWNDVKEILKWDFSKENRAKIGFPDMFDIVKS